MRALHAVVVLLFIPVAGGVRRRARSPEVTFSSIPNTEAAEAVQRKNLERGTTKSLAGTRRSQALHAGTLVLLSGRRCVCSPPARAGFSNPSWLLGQ